MQNSRYRAFQKTAQTQSLTKASEALGYTQSGVSHLIKALEDEVGFALFIRSKSGVKLTSEGERLLPYIEHALLAEKDIDTVAEEVRGLTVGTVRIGTFSSVAIHWLPKILSSFNAHYPGITVTMMNGTYSIIEAALLEDGIDCGFVTLPTQNEFTVESLMRDRLLAILHVKNPLSSHRYLTPQLLAEEPFIIPAEGINHDIGKLFATANVKPNVRFDVNDNYAAMAMVCQGLGFTILPELMAQDMHFADVKTIPLLDSEREIGIATNKARYLSPAVKAFIAIVNKITKAYWKR